MGIPLPKHGYSDLDTPLYLASGPRRLLYRLDPLDDHNDVRTQLHLATRYSSQILACTAFHPLLAFVRLQHSGYGIVLATAL